LNPAGAGSRRPQVAYVQILEYHTYMPKLTLSVDEKVVGRAKRYAARHDTSVSQMVERYLDLVVAPARPDEQDPPVLRMLRGAAKGVTHEDYGRHLRRKYR
jgi:hypothetical protein